MHLYFTIFEQSKSIELNQLLEIIQLEGHMGLK